MSIAVAMALSFCMAIGAFVAQWITGHDWRAAFNASYFQTMGVLAAYLVMRLRS